MKYTFSDEEEVGSDVPSTRRSNRHSGVSTPAEPVGPNFTASGRQVRSRRGGTYGETILSGQQDDQTLATKAYDGYAEDGEEGAITRGRTRGASSRNGVVQSIRSGNRTNSYNAVDAMDDESDATSSGGEWDGDDDDDEVDEHVAEEDSNDDTEMSDNNKGDLPEEVDTDQQSSLVVSLRYHQKKPKKLDIQAQAGWTSGYASVQTGSTNPPNGHNPKLHGMVKEDPGIHQSSPAKTKEPPTSKAGLSPIHRIEDLVFQQKQLDYSLPTTNITTT